MRIVTVHGIGSPARALDPGEDRTWIGVDQFRCALDAMVDATDVRMTFDDGNASDVEIALPMLVERGLDAEFFVLAGQLGDPGRIDDAGAKDLDAAGMAIGSHGWNHRDWRRLTPGEVREELVEAPDRLATLLGRTVDRVAVPFGSYDRHVLARLRSVGTTRVFTSDGGTTSGARWLQSRTSLRADMDHAAIRALVLDRSESIVGRLRRTAATTVKRHRGSPPAR